MPRRRFQLLRSPLDQYLPGVRGWVLAGALACIALIALPALGWAEVMLGLDAAALMDTDVETHPVVVRWAVGLLVVAMLAAASVSLWNLQMRRKVRQQTQALREEVSRRERMERELRANQSMLANAQRVARMGSWERDLRTNRLVWSEETYRIFDFDPKSFPGTYEAFVARIHPDDRTKRDAALTRAMEGDGLTSVEYRIRRSDGTVRIIYERGEIIRDANGERARKVGMVMDVTEQRASEHALREKDALLRMAGNLGRIGGWTMELPGRQVIWSDEACSIHDMPPGSSPTVDQLIESYAPEYRISVRHAFEACAQQGVPFELEARLALSSGRRPWVRVIGEAGRDDNGDVVRVKGALQDITDRKALEQQFLRAQRQESIGTLAGGIAHDLNNVLTPILMSINLLKLNARDPDDLRMLDTIGVSARRGADMVRQVLSFARGAPGTRVPTPVSQLIGDIERIIKDTFPRSIGCERRVPEDIWPVLCDPTQIHQVLLNLCVNARDAMSDGGVLTLVAGNVELGERDTRFHGAGKIGRHVKIEVSIRGRASRRTCAKRSSIRSLRPRRSARERGLVCPRWQTSCGLTAAFSAWRARSDMDLRSRFICPRPTPRQSRPVRRRASVSRGVAARLLWSSTMKRRCASSCGRPLKCSAIVYWKRRTARMRWPSLCRDPKRSISCSPTS